MIESLTGNVTQLTPATVVIETPSGVGYLVNISLPCYDRLQGSEKARLVIHESIREDAWTLYGFCEEHERQLFRLLIGVSGVGANTARLILSALPAAQLEQVITTGDLRRLKSVKGIGAKTAERIIVDLKDKVKASDPVLIQAATATNTQAFEDALMALVALGFAKPLSQKALERVFDADPSVSANDAVKRAMAHMK